MQIKLSATVAVLFATLFLHILSPVDAQTQNPLQQALLFTLESNPTSVLGFASSSVDPTTVDRKLLEMYIKNNLYPLWLNEDGPGMKAQALLEVLQNSHKDGVNPVDYHIESMLELWQSRDPVQLAGLDVMLTLALGTYVTDMREGRADPCLLDPKLFASARDKEVDIEQLVVHALAAADLTIFLMQQSPAHQAYLGLRKALAKYSNIADQGGWQTIAAGPTIKPGMEDKRLPLIAGRLAVTGDLSEIPPDSTLYSDTLVEAVNRFQQRFNLEVDGVIGKKTLAAMNIPVQDLIERIIINMERWRWLPNKLDGKRILVNIAGFQLAGINNEQVEIHMPVIVGKVYHKTPVFSNTLRYIVLNPFWNIPSSIAVNETRPSQIENPEYLQ
ncbi:MAG: L,D-transpeptidase family protein, partial [Desulfobulbaceae bacterium]|nr:L,D-transpeptidase family protein [Desulfobulbaceae bacterium]